MGIFGKPDGDIETRNKKKQQHTNTQTLTRREQVIVSRLRMGYSLRQKFNEFKKEVYLKKSNNWSPS
jgi:hypothetical protein